MIASALDNDVRNCVIDGRSCIIACVLNRPPPFGTPHLRSDVFYRTQAFPVSISWFPDFRDEIKFLFHFSSRRDRPPPARMSSSLWTTQQVWSTLHNSDVLSHMDRSRCARTSPTPILASCPIASRSFARSRPDNSFPTTSGAMPRCAKCFYRKFIQKINEDFVLDMVRCRRCSFFNLFRI